MNVHTEDQIITQNGKPAFAVVPWEKYQMLIKNLDKHEEADVWFPNDVVKANSRGDCLIKAWREHFELTQIELAVKAGIKQSALARLETGNSTPRKTTLSKLAKALDINIEQLID